jgi:hypothetical protein
MISEMACHNKNKNIVKEIMYLKGNVEVSIAAETILLV